MFVSSDGSLKPPGVNPGDLNRFSFRPAGTTGRWNPSRKPPRVIQSGEQVNIYCHSVGVGPYGSISKPPAEASPVMYTELSGDPGKLFVPVHPSAFESPDRDLIQKYDKGELSHGDKLAFEKIGLITSRQLAPGPTEVREIRTSIGADTSMGGNIGVSLSYEVSKEYTFIDGKRDTIDYKKLQKPKYDQLDLDWGHARRAYFSSISKSPFSPGAVLDVRTQQLATFTVLFE
jgi:hypothetical protein